MKPIVIGADHMTFTDIKDAIDEAYQAGLVDGYDKGYADGKKSMPLTWRGDPVPTNTPNPNWWYDNKYEVTCSDENKFNSKEV